MIFGHGRTIAQISFTKHAIQLTLRLGSYRPHDPREVLKCGDKRIWRDGDCSITYRGLVAGFGIPSGRINGWGKGTNLRFPHLLLALRRGETRSLHMKSRETPLQRDYGFRLGRLGIRGLLRGPLLELIESNWWLPANIAMRPRPPSACGAQLVRQTRRQRQLFSNSQRNGATSPTRLTILNSQKKR